MQTNERHEVRQSFLNMGFNRTGYSADTSGVGDYTETWTHPDGSVIEIQWAARTPREDADMDSGDENAEAIRAVHQSLLYMVARAPSLDVNVIHASNPQTAEPVVDAPGMYDEPDMGLDLHLGVSDEEDRIPGGAPASTMVQPEALAPFLNKHVSITSVDGGVRTSVSGYPVDVWRFNDETALAVRMTTHPDEDLGDTFVLADDAEWQIVPTANPKDALHHRPSRTTR